MNQISIEQNDAIEIACRALTKGELVIFPTETCYGLGADATNEEAVLKLLDFKGGRGRKAVSIAVDSRDMALKAVELNEIAENIYQTLLPGPITVVSKAKKYVCAKVVSERNTLGIRIPDYDWTLKLIRTFGKPITATSANSSGKKPPYSIEEWKTYTSEKKQSMISVFCDAQKLQVNPPSTILDTTLNNLTVLRQGEIKIAGAINAKTVVTDSVEETKLAAASIFHEYSRYLVDRPVILALKGELGAGKTHFVKGLAEAMGIVEPVNSPTYVMVKEYQTEDEKMKLIHIDTWRMEEQESLESLGIKAHLNPQTIIAIEWMEKAKQELEALTGVAKVVLVEIEGSGDDERTISIKTSSE